MRSLRYAFVLVAMATLAACGGGGGGASPFGSASGVAATTASAVVAVPTQTITGTAAYGAALGGATITVKDSSNPSKTVSTVAAATGAFTLDVTGFTAPIMLQAAHVNVGVNYLYSVVPTLNATVTSISNVNLTPITTLTMYELNNGADPGNMFRSSTFTTVTNALVNSAETTVRTTLARSLTAAQTVAFNLVPTGFSMMTGGLVVGDVYDKLLDAIGKITAYQNGSVTLTTIAGVTTLYAKAVPTTAAAAVAAKVQLLLSNPQLLSATGSTIGLTAVVLDGANQTIAGRAVTFSVAAGETAFINNIGTAGSNLSDVNGTVKATLNIGSNKANRTFIVTALVDAVSITSTVNVTGTTISVSGNSSIALGANANLTFAVKDSAGVALPATPVVITSLKGNTLTSTGITDATGTVVATGTGIVAGVDTITATAAGATNASTLTVSADSFAFQNATVIPPEIPLNTLQTFSVAWTNASGVVVAQPVSFSSTRGTVALPNPAFTAAGVANVSVSSSSAGAAIITATGTGGTPSATLQVNFVATSASFVVAQSNPSTIQVSSGSAAQTNNTATISAVVRDANNNLVKNATVNFSILLDPSGGSLNSPTAITDINGLASVSYTAGTTASPQNGVQIVATVAAVRGVATAIPPTSTVMLTVSGQTLFVRLGTDNTVALSPPTNLLKTYSAIVTDAAGNPMVNQKVSFVLRPNVYWKGFYVKGATTWLQFFTVPLPLLPLPQVQSCLNEDLNFNGTVDLINPKTGMIDPILGISEDTNLNGRLDPGGIASVNAFGITDLNGVATASIVYPKDHANWVEVTLEATAGVVGTDPPTRATFTLPGLATDYSNLLVSPPGYISPFGEAAICTSPL